MKSLWMGAAAGTLLVAVVPACAQEDPVKAGVDSYERGDYKTAVGRWRPAAERGNADAQFNLGQAYKLGRGVPVDLQQAEQWYRKAALQGHEQAEANYALALFENGKRAEAVPWLERAVTRGDARVQYVYGVMLFNGDGVAKDWVRAYALIVRASQSGLDAASKALAQMDQYVPIGDRQQGLSLARKYEQEYNSGPRPLPPVNLAAMGPDPARPVTLRPSPRPVPSAPERAEARPSAPTPQRSRPAPQPAATPRDGGWRVQLGAFGDAGNAHRLWSQVAGRFPGRQPYYVRAGTLTRLLVGPFGSRGEAASACGSVRPCVAVQR